MTMTVQTRRLVIAVLLASTAFRAVPSRAADHMGADQVREAVKAAPAGKVDLSGRDMSSDDLTDLDLSGADLAKANLTGANLHGVKLVGADLTGADLSRADLTFAWFIKARFDHANLRGAAMQTVVTSKAMDNTADQAASFVGADLSDSNTTVHFSFDDMRGVSFAHAHMSAVIANQSMGLLRTEFMRLQPRRRDLRGRGAGPQSVPLRQAAERELQGGGPVLRGLHRRLPGRRGLHRGEAGQGDVQGREHGRHQGAGATPGRQRHRLSPGGLARTQGCHSAGSSSPGSGARSAARARIACRPSGCASPARRRKNSAAVSTAPTFCATAEAIHWLSDTPSCFASRAAAALIEAGSLRG